MEYTQPYDALLTFPGRTEKRDVMERLTKTYDDGTHAAADNLPCGENSWNYKELLLNKLGAYEDTGLRPCEILVLSDKLKYASEQWDIWCNAYQKEVPVWISVEERLPEREEWMGTKGEEHYLRKMEIAVSSDTIEYFFVFYDGYKWFDKFGRTYAGVVAWKIHESYNPQN